MAKILNFPIPAHLPRLIDPEGKEHWVDGHVNDHGDVVLPQYWTYLSPPRTVLLLAKGDLFLDQADLS